MPILKKLAVILLNIPSSSAYIERFYSICGLVYVWLYVDGTFQVAPLLYKQVVTVNVIYRGKNLPLVYSLLPNKQEVTYTRFFKMLVNNEINPMKSPARFIVDFELAIINCLEKLYDSEVCGCYFHYTQSMWRNVSKKGLIHVFNEDPLVRLAYRRIKSLPFLKVKVLVIIQT
ncbi:unnamed protein product [Brachionus calyciflorus]|uniref:MULE transposase domain-containing protein n=1 Tax=Brachionus calyciflorus TaxID=104777 RepID=A0A814FJZ4_9BILA|nr:unnamed protein product [Brachionus calyciflorus]